MGKYALVTLLICCQCRLSDEQMQNITRIAKAALHKGRSPQICTVCYSVTSKNVVLIP